MLSCAHMNLGSIILDMIFPRHCLGCKNIMPIDQVSYVCRACTSSIQFLNQFRCAFCYRPQMDASLCKQCRPHHALDELCVATSYDTPLVASMVKVMKYKFIKSITANLADLMSNYAKIHLQKYFDPENVIATSIPMHYRRENWRGFNQSQQIAQRVSMQLALPYYDILKKEKTSKPQAEIESREQRLQNLHNNFSVINTEMVKNKTIILIDDVATTSTTLDMCAKILKKAGARKIIGFVFARSQQ